MRQVTASVDDPLDADHVASDVEEDQVVPGNCEACIHSDLWAELIEERLLADLKDLPPNFLEKRNGSRRIVLCDEIGDCFQIAFDEAGEF